MPAWVVPEPLPAVCLLVVSIRADSTRYGGAGQNRIVMQVCAAFGSWGGLGGAGVGDLGVVSSGVDEGDWWLVGGLAVSWSGGCGVACVVWLIVG